MAFHFIIKKKIIFLFYLLAHIFWGKCFIMCLLVIYTNSTFPPRHTNGLAKLSRSACIHICLNSIYASLRTSVSSCFGCISRKKGAFDYLKVDYLLFQQVPKQHKFNPGQIFFGEEFGS